MEEQVGRAPRCGTFREFLGQHARVLQRDGIGGRFSLEGRAPLDLVVDWLDKVLRNTIGRDPGSTGDATSRHVGTPAHAMSAEASGAPPATAGAEAVEIDGVLFQPGQLKGASLAVGGGAQFGKTVLELNLMAYATAIRFLSVGNYLPDRPKVEEIVGQKFRPNVLDLYPWMAQMIQLGKVQNASGKTIDRKESYTVTDGQRKSFGNFCGLHKPPTSLTLDLALLDEVDDIDERNIGYVDARMTNSPVHLTCFIGTQRVAGAGQNARLKGSSFHVCMVACPGCGREWCLEEEWPRCVRREERTASGERRTGPDPIISAEMGHDRLARYYAACPECGTELDRDGGRYVARRPERIPQAKLGVRVSQLNISAISMQEIVGAWYAAFEDPSGNALAAFCCDRLAIPHAGAAQPITQAVLDECRRLGLASGDTGEPYAMSLRRAADARAAGESPAAAGGPPLVLGSLDGLSTGHRDHEPGDSRARPPGGRPEACPTGRRDACPTTCRFMERFAGMDMGPRCWFWCDEVRGPLVSACVWAELIASGNAPVRVPLLMNALGIACLLLDAGGEPDLTKRLVLALNGLEDYLPPAIPRPALLSSHLAHLGVGVTWDGQRARWQGIRAAAVLFVRGQARGLEQTIGFTQEGRIYPLIKCSRSESIQTAVNDFLTPAEGVVEIVRSVERESVERESVESRRGGMESRLVGTGNVRALPRARLPQSYIGPGVSQAVLDGHLLNVRKERDPRSGAEDWIEGVENHLGLAKTYARLAHTLSQTEPGPPLGAISSLEGIRSGSGLGRRRFQPGRLLS